MKKQILLEGIMGLVKLLHFVLGTQGFSSTSFGSTLPALTFVV